MSDLKHKPNLRWWQFSLRKLLLMVTFLSIMGVVAYRFVEWGNDLADERYDLVLQQSAPESEISFLKHFKKMHFDKSIDHPDIVLLQSIAPDFVNELVENDKFSDTHFDKKLRATTSVFEHQKKKLLDFETTYAIPLRVHRISKWLNENNYFLSWNLFLITVFWASASAFVLIVMGTGYRWFIRGNESRRTSK